MAISYTATVDASEVFAGLRRMEGRAKRVRAFYRAMKRPTKKDIREHGDKAEGPDGAWAPRSASYMGKRKRVGKKKRRRRKAPRRVLGKLTRAVRQRISSGGLRIESPIPWAGAHQFGDTVGRGSVLPERPFLWLSDDVVELAKRGYLEYVLSAYPKGARLAFGSIG